MARFLARRFAYALLLVVAVSSAALILTRFAPGDVTAQLGPFAPADEIARTRARFDLDRSPVRQWATWVGRSARLDLGDSFLYNRPVSQLLGPAGINTAILAVAALAVATLIGIPLGIFTGSRRGGVLSNIVRGVSLVCLSLPPLLMSLLLVFLAAETGWLPVGGMSSIGARGLDWSGWLSDVALHLPVPVLALALPIAATFERLQSQSMSETVHQPFVLAALARGVTRNDIIVRHAWPASLRPICAIYGLVIGALLSGSFVVEYVTAWPGLGRLMFEALRARDIYLVAGCAALGGFFLAVGSIIADLLLAAADPRVRDGDAA
jgi:peptide/nickel transport system permease protein